MYPPTAAYTEVLDDKTPQNGDFFVYGRQGKDLSEEAVLCVVFKSKLTHHLTQFLGGSWVVGKKSYGRFATLEEVCGPVILPQSVLTRLQCIPRILRPGDEYSRAHYSPFNYPSLWVHCERKSKAGLRHS